VRGGSGCKKKGQTMALYEYRCPTDGPFEVLRPLGKAPDTMPCKFCGEQAPRAITAPRIRSAARSAWHTAIEHADKSRWEPEVVTSLPSTGPGPRRGALHPAMLNLPRP
jgi:putative FmdB family regulatory protein